MYLKRLDIHGFKSFADKVRFDFIKGVTAVVGPNGSGKSNVADAIRWVLGEQSAKSLRGAKMEDVIFSGASGRNALGFAEVSLTLDNSDGALNVEYSEVSITRRVYRSGESEYQINNTVCRLKDIHELLMDTGIGREGYSIIGQGRVDELLSARAEDRRYVFEEAAGIVKYKSRKAEAIAKLEKERQNLVRINDIMAELTSQLEPLKRQSETAHRYLELKDKLKALQVNIFLNETDKADKELKSYNESLSQLTVRRKSGDEKLAEIKAVIDSLKADLSANTSESAKENENLTDIRLRIEQKENDIKLMEQQISHIDDGGERLKADIERVMAQRAKDTEYMASEEVKKARLESELVEMANEIARQEEDFRLFAERTAEDDKKVGAFNREIIELINESNGIKGIVNKLEAAYDSLEERKERIQNELSALRAEKAEREASAVRLSRELSDAEQEFDKLSKELRMLSAESAEYHSKLKLKADECQNLHRECAEATARHKILSDLESEYEGYAHSVKAVLMLKSRAPDKFSGVLGTVGELLSVPSQYETAIEIALGGAIQNIVVTDEGAASLVIKHLKETKAGRATFLPLTAMRPKSFAMRDKLAMEHGFIGTAAELTEYEEPYASVFEHLLGRTAVVDTMENAVNIFKKYRYDIRIVTLGGELLNPGGAITGGSTGRKDTGIISRGRLIKTLAEKIGDLSMKIGIADKEASSLKAQIEIISTDAEQANTMIKSKSLEKEACVKEIKLHSERIDALESKINILEADDKAVIEKITSTNSEIRSGAARITDMERKISEKEKSLAEFENSILLDREGKNAKMLVLMELKAQAGALEQRIKSAHDNIKRIAVELDAHLDELERLKSETGDLTHNKERIEAESQRIRHEISLLRADRENSRHRIDVLNQAIQALNGEINEKEEYYRVLLTEMSSLNADIARLESKKEQLETDARKLYDNMWDEYKITYITAREYQRIDMPPTALIREEKRVKNEISGLGVVNIQGIEEYKAVKSRYDFLSEQRDDIAAAEEKLGIVIKELTELMEKRFLEQFEKISESFGIVFKEIFGGGQAYLRLSDENDALGSGIEIISQPPGKTLSNMNLLSGGEHALTAIALLFGILRLKPSPFCLLDEIESALDDANVARFANFLNNFSGGTQFVVITHRKKTMEAAEALYGITMQEQGVSKPVSVRFTEEAV